MSMKRKSIYAEGFSHKNPIPAACQVGNMLYSGSIQGTDAVTGAYGKNIDDQCRLMFAHIERIIKASGASMDNIIKMTVWMKDRTQRAPLNQVWLEAFPDPSSRPARHTMQAPLDGEKLIECDFIAVLNP